MIALEEAVSRILGSLPEPVGEHVPLVECAGRFLATDITASLALPPFDNSSMDGYAVRAADVVAATAERPVILRVVGKIPAGGDSRYLVRTGECARLFTGSPVPAGADAVVMQEDTRVVAGSPDQIQICDQAVAGENVRRCGEDVPLGAVIGLAGEALAPGRVALLAAQGLREITVGRRPVVGLLATGSELRSAGESLAPGQIYESNRAMLTPLIARAGGLPRVYPLVPDTIEATRAALDLAFAECDLVVTSGGASVGEMDLVKAAFATLGGELGFWKVAIRPGKPFLFGRCGAKFLCGLPGNPVSAFVTFLLLVRPALLRWQGAHQIGLRVRHGVLAEALQNRGDRSHFLRVRVDEAGVVRSAGPQASHALGSLAEANGLLDLAQGAVRAKGESVQVLGWD